MSSQRFMQEIIKENVSEFSANPTSVRRAWNAVVSLLQIADYLAIERSNTVKEMQCALAMAHSDFTLLIGIGNAFKHLERDREPYRGLSARDVEVGPESPFADGQYFDDDLSWTVSKEVIRIRVGERVVDVLCLCEAFLAYLQTRYPSSPN